ncbi:acyltransferase [Serratia liquefaciens]|uniref:acyltransferase n=1 Tax=Serratia liquefaciens TaxID=614 RepID=UPI0021C72E30|nr:acyltransferase [Serratia liquefaciens]
MIANLKKLNELCKKAECHIFHVLIMNLFYRTKGLRGLFSANKVKVKGLKNISLTSDGVLLLGLRNVNHVSNKTESFYNIRGRLLCQGTLSFGRGYRVDINNGAVLILSGGYIGPENDFIVYNGISIGKDCNISWGCQFLDDDFHHLNYTNKKNKDKIINIGDHVWIGCNVSVLKGTNIASGCVVAANSVVSGDFLESNCLIAGSPARVVKRNISWKL